MEPPMYGFVAFKLSREQPINQYPKMVNLAIALIWMSS